MTPPLATSRCGLVGGVFMLLLVSQIILLPDVSNIALGGYDDLFQLALGLKTTHGAWPGLDFFTNYGPGVAVLSALSWSWPNPVLVETLTGALLISIGLLAFWLAGRASDHPVQNTLLLAALLFSAPAWPKYYYVLWPGLFLLTLGDTGACRPPNAQRRRWLLLGIIIGLGGWFRLEIGLALAAALAGALVVRWRSMPSGGPGPSALAAYAVAGALAPWLAYFGAAWIFRGRLEGPFDLLDFYVTSTLAKANDFHSIDGVPRLSGFFGAESISGCLGLVTGAGALSIVALCFPRRVAVIAATPLARRAWCAAWLLLCLSPQALHRIDRYHTQHILGPGLVAAALGLACWLKSAESGVVTRFTTWRQPGAFAAFGLLAGLCAIIQFHIAPPLTKTIPRLRSLVGGLASLDPSLSDVALAAELHARTADTDTILIPSLDSRFYVLADRPFAGLFPHWSFQLPKRWTDRQLDALRSDRPALVAYADYYRGIAANDFMRILDFKGRNPQLDAFVNETYPDIVYQNPDWRILAPIRSP
ncbi:MAG: hypothetical protein H7Y06_13810 [Opitutaceae bacterium]|nr:hypothetical protein [Opitutaceae bacterium]